MLNFIKKQSIGMWLALGCLVLTIISLIIYAVNVGGQGYFYTASVKGLVPITIGVIVMLLAVLVVPQFKFEGIVKKIINIAMDVLIIVAAALLVLAMMNFISSRVEGLAYIYFSNVDILATIQTPENLASAGSAISGFIFFGIAWLMAMVTAFFSITTKKI